MNKLTVLLASILILSSSFAQEEPTPKEAKSRKVRVEKTREKLPAVRVDAGEYEIVDSLDVKVEFPKGSKGIRKYMKENLIYPESSRKNGDQGLVLVTFVVESDGTISNVDLIRGQTIQLNSEAIRLVSAMPRWTPGLVNGKTVDTRCRLPITFTIRSDKKNKK